MCGGACVGEKSGSGYYHISNAMQYSNTALKNTALVVYDSKSFSFRIRNICNT